MCSAAYADEIADDLLFRTGRAVITNDAKSLIACFEFPFIIGTQDGTRMIEAQDGLLQILERLRRYYSDNNVVDVVRTVVSAKFENPNSIGTTSVARLIQPAGKQFRAPYPIYSTLSNQSGSWKIVSCTYAILDSPDHNKALLAGL